MRRRPPRSTRTDHSFPTRRSSDLRIHGRGRTPCPTMDPRDKPEGDRKRGREGGAISTSDARDSAQKEGGATAAAPLEVHRENSDVSRTGRILTTTDRKSTRLNSSH